MNFNITYDASVANAPVSFRTTVAAVAQFFQNAFSNPITINISIGYGEVGGSALDSGALGESLTYLASNTYSQIKNALVADAKSNDDKTAVASLASVDPTNGGNFWVPMAEAKALGLSGASSGLDGSVGFSAMAAFDYDKSNGISPGQYDFYGVVAHQISEVMGRQLLVGAAIGATPNGYDPLDLFHYSASG